MDYEPDYSTYKTEELIEARRTVDRGKYPNRSQRIDSEISRRIKIKAGAGIESKKSKRKKAFEIPENATELPFEFNGKAMAYFRIWIVNLCLTLITFGIFSAWAKVRKKRYVYSHTRLDGTPFQYLAQPIPILKGRLIAAIGFALYYLATHFFGFLMPYVLGAGLILAPWVIVRSAAFNARYSAFRNMTFHFDGRYFGAAKTIYVWGLVPLFAVGMMFIPSMMTGLKKINIIVGIVFIAIAFSGSVYFPFWMRRFKHFIVTHTAYGNQKGKFSATGGQFFKIYFKAGLFMLGIGILAAIFGGVLTVVMKNKTWGTAVIIPILMYVGYIFSFAYVRANRGNLVWNSIRLGPIRFHSTLNWWELMKLYISNAIGIIFSLGLLIPWAIIRTLKYRIDHLQAIQLGELAQFQGTKMDAVGAAGAETLDFFDVDLSL